MVNQREGGPRKQAGRTVAAASRGQKKYAGTCLTGTKAVTRNEAAGMNKIGFRSYRLSSERYTLL